MTRSKPIVAIVTLSSIYRDDIELISYIIPHHSSRRADKICMWACVLTFSAETKYLMVYITLGWYRLILTCCNPKHNPCRSIPCWYTYRISSRLYLPETKRITLFHHNKQSQIDVTWNIKGTVKGLIWSYLQNILLKTLIMTHTFYWNSWQKIYSIYVHNCTKYWNNIGKSWKFI